MAAVELRLTRRQWLLGALTAAAGCTGARSRLPAGLTGGLIGPDHRRGHLLRDGGAPGGPPALELRTEVAILGGGVSGLSAAWALRRAGLEDLAVLELEHQAGGTSRHGQGPITPYPWGAHYLPVPSRDSRAVAALLEELGVVRGYDAAGRALCAEEALCRSPQERIFHKGRWYEGLYLRAGASAEDLRQLDRFHDEVGRWVRARGQGGGRAFTLPQALGDRRAAAELDQLTMAAYLDRLGLRSPRLRWQVDYACRDDFGLPATEASAWAGMHYYASRLLHPDDRPPEVLTWPEGNGWLAERLAAPLGPRLHTGCLVLDVRPLGGAGPDQVEVRFLKEQPDGTQVPGVLRARAAVFALPVFLRPHIIAPLRAAAADPARAKEHSWLGAFRYAPWLVANLTLRRPPSPPVALGASLGHRGATRTAPGCPPCWDNVLYDSPSLGYVVATHQREPPLPADGVPRSVWTYYLPLCGGPPAAERRRLAGTSWEAWCQVILQDLGRAEPDLLRQIERIDIFRWAHGMVRPEPGLITGEALERAAAPIGPIRFAHTDLAGMALFEEAQHAGVRAAEAVMAARGHRFEAL